MRGFSYYGDTVGGGAYVIGPHFTTQFGLKTHLPKTSAMALGTSAWLPIYFSMLAQPLDVPVAQKRGKALQYTPVVLGRFSSREFLS